MKRYLGLALLAATLYAGYFANQNLPVIPGFVAQYSCGDIFISGRQDTAQVYSDAVATHPAFELATITVNKEQRSVTAQMAFGLFKRTAQFRQHLGCTLVIDSDTQALQQQAELFHFDIKSQFPKQTLATAASITALEAVLDNAFSEPSADSQRNTRAVVIVKNGLIVAERYSQGFDKNSALLGWSEGKSLMNTFAGILSLQGKLSIDESNLFPQWANDKRKTITIDHLLNMSSGLDFLETYDVGDDATKMLFNAYDASAYALQSPLTHKPGSHWSYSSGTSNILAQLLRERAGGSPQSFYDFRWKTLFGPLGMHSVVIGPDAEGDIIGSSFMYASARDWAKFGLLYLNDGMYKNRRILPKGWVDYTRTPLAHTKKGQYKAQFWLNAGNSDNPKQRMWPQAPRDAYAAQGHDKQRTFIVPSENLVIVRLGRTLDKSWDDGQFIADVIAAVNP